MKQFDQVKFCAINLLARRERSQLELKRKLIARGFSKGVIDNVLTVLSKENLQNDERFVESYIRMRMNRGYGPLRILAELRKRGIAADVAGELLDTNDSVWFEQVQIARCKKFGNENPKDFQQRSKQAQFLQYKGFTGEQIKYVLSA